MVPQCRMMPEALELSAGARIIHRDTQAEMVQLDGAGRELVCVGCEGEGEDSASWTKTRTEQLGTSVQSRGHKGQGRQPNPAYG